MNAPKILIRADADKTIGTGHVMRCIAIAQELRLHGCTIHFILASSTASVIHRIESEGFFTHKIRVTPGTEADADLTGDFAGSLGASWIVIDGYTFDGKYQNFLKSRGFSLLCIDDYGHAGEYFSDIILNPNIYAGDITAYPARPEIRCLLGPRYALIRREIRAWKDTREQGPHSPFRILVTLGGSDPDNHTLEIISALEKLPEDSISVRIIIGGSNPHVSKISEHIKSSGRQMTVLHDIRDMGEQYAWADIAITSAGSTTSELAYFGVPMVAVVIADNQERVAASLSEKKAGFNLGRMTKKTGGQIRLLVKKFRNSPDLCREISRNASSLIDGNGTARIWENMFEVPFFLRGARPYDCWTIFSWINEPHVRGVSFNENPILWDEHMEWYLKKLEDPESRYFIITLPDNTPAGQVRYDIGGTDATVSILVDPRFRGRNYSVMAMRRSAEIIFSQTPVKKIHAYIKPDNIISCNAFMKAGYTYYEPTMIGHTKARHLVLLKGGV